MSTTENTPDTTTQTDTLSLDFELAHKPEKVWRALTTPELLAQWLLPVTGFGLETGTKFTLQTQAYPGWDGKVHCRMIEADATKKISYAWVVGDMELDTVVTLTLTPTDSGTKLNVTQSGFKSTQKRESGGARYGWQMMGGKLAEVLASLA